MVTTSLLPLIAIGAIAVGLLTMVIVLAVGSGNRIAKSRLTSVAHGPEQSALTGASQRVQDVIERRIGGQTGSLASKMDIAQMKIAPQEYVLWVGVVTMVLAAILMIVFGGSLFGVVLGLVIGALGGYAYVELALGRTRRQFAEQLDESLQVMAGSLRAGYSLMQAIGTLAGPDGAAPSRDEFARVINQTRIGRPVGEALEETALRMRSEDFTWVAQAIAINREVGGNLANVLDGVGATIRERGVLQRQVRSLAAEGKMSAIILVSLPLVLLLIIKFMNPHFFDLFFTTGIYGYATMGVAVVLMIIGILVMRAMVQLKY